MKKIKLITIFTLLSLISLGQDSNEIKNIKPVWVEPEVVFETPKIEPKEEISTKDVESIQNDLIFLEKLPTTYENVSEEDLKNVLKDINVKITRLIQERDSLVNLKEVNQELVDEKNSTIKTLNKEKDIIELELESDELKTENGTLEQDKNILKIEKETYKKYLYWTISSLILLTLAGVVLTQKKIIKIKDEEIESQLEDINKKNTYLEHAAKIIRHDMHSGINTYIPRGLTSLEKRVSPDDLAKLKIDTSIRMIKDGLAHTQRVYKSVYEFTNLVKQHVVLDKKTYDLKLILENFISNTSYSSQVKIDNLIQSDVNEILFCNAVDNLIRNGLKYNDSESKYVNIYMEENFLVVKDNGRGLTQKQFEKIIKPKKSETKENEGGLGLSISNVIFKEHGFEMFCDNKNGGTEIKIKLK